MGGRTIIGLAGAVAHSGDRVLVGSAWGHAAGFNGFDVSNALVPLSQIRSGGPPRDGIPAIDRPRFGSPRAARGLQASDLVVSVTVEGRTRAYRLLSDSEAVAAKAFGIAFQVEDDLVKMYKESYQIDLEAASGQTHHILPHPAVFVADTKGTIRFAYVNSDYKVRLEPAKILERAKAARKHSASVPLGWCKG